MLKFALNKAEIREQISDYEQNLAFLEKQKDLYSNQSRIPAQLKMDIEIIQQRIDELYSELNEAR